ncbi:MAG: homocysteine S-methyltransferase, partial [Candidatus Hydrogenedentes bacterium]|nr:homocysteine S-methyltransferase [Candidatus Hydrogenedentota bacterium]
MKHPFKPFLDDFGVVILDGAMATELERRGAELEDSLWSAKVLLESPELIREVHFDYFAAGADVAITASYQATFRGLGERGLSRGEAADLIRLSVQLAREARDAFWEDPARREGRLRPLIAGSVGCYGAYLADGSEYRGDYGLSRSELVEFHRGRIEVLAGAGLDLLACETIPCKVEAEALVEVLGEFPETPAWLSFSCRDDEHVWEGDRLADCTAVVEG